MSDKDYWYCMAAYAYAQSGDYAKASNLYSLAYDNAKSEEMKIFCSNVEELYSLDDGKEHNIKEIYKNINEYASKLNISFKFESECFEVMYSLNGNWYDRTRYGSTSNFYCLKIKDGKIEWYKSNGKKQVEYDLYYKNGNYYIGLPTDVDYKKIKEYDFNENSFVMEHKPNKYEKIRDRLFTK